VNIVKRALPVLVLIAAALNAQEMPSYPLGAILNEEAYNALPRKAPPSSGNYGGLPPVFSLKSYAPQPGDQADYGTCVAWAAAYGARTISESVALSRVNRDETTRNAFSPFYVYRRIRPDDTDFLWGARIDWALDLMKDSGAVKMLDLERGADFQRVEISSYNGSKKYPIADYVTLYSRDERGKPGLVTRMVKRSLVEGKPVIIGMNTPLSFLDARGVWFPKENPDMYYGGHAMCVVGYDDSRHGGAFEVLNSWGRKWGNGGFMWIPYKVFVDFVMESYEMIENLTVYTDNVDFAGFARLEIFDGLRYLNAPLLSDAPGFYRSASVPEAGTAYRFTAGSGEIAYMYAFTASRAPDPAGGPGGFYSPVLLFPQAGLSPLLNSGDEVRIPAGEKPLVLDSEAGAACLVLLYAKQPLDIRGLMRRFENAAGNDAAGRLAQALGKDLLSDGVDFDEKDALFTAETDNSRAVAALVLVLEHH
jgi:hypothetical protein